MAAPEERTKTCVMPDARPKPWDDAAHDPLLAGLPLEAGHRVLDPYIIYGFVGQGGMGKVFRARHLRLDCDVAIKFLKADWSQRGSDAYSRFAREAKLGARLSSENLVHVTDLGRHGALQYLVMEWVDGENLHQRVRRLGPRPVDEAVTLLRGIARALAEVHAHGAEHRDVKPGNAILSRRGIVKLADLGLASSFEEDELAASVEICGTPSFMAPEQWRGLREARSEADVYALGATAVWLLTGTTPGQATPSSVPSVEATLRGAPADLAAFVRRCMALQAVDRPADGTEALAELNRLPYGSPDGRLDVTGDAFDGDGQVPLPADEVERVRTSMRAGTTTRRRTGRATLLGLGLATVVVFGASWLLGRGGGTEPAVAPAAAGGAALPTPPAPGATAEPKLPPAPTAAAQVTEAPVADERAAPPVALPRLTAVGHAVDALLAVGGAAELPTSLQWRQPVELGARVALELTVRIDGAHDDLQVTLGGGSDGTVRASRGDDGAWRVHLDLSPRRHRVHLVPLRAGQPGPAHDLDVDVPCTTPELEHLRLETADPRVPIVHYRLPHERDRAAEAPPHALDHVFVPVDADLLVAVTELTVGQFLAFARDGDAFGQGLGGDAAYVDVLQTRHTRARRDELLAWRRDGLTAVLSALPAEQPVTQVLPHEVLAFTRWLAAQSGVAVRVPTSVEWARIANRNARRALDSTLRWPVASGDAPANLSVPARDPVGEELPGTEAVPELQPVWGRPQGALHLRHLAGNAAELCIDELDSGSPRAGTFAGGSFMDTEALLAGRGPEPWRAAGGKLAELDRTTNGVRLVVGPLTLRRR
jgi:hypothetical protein